MWTCIGPFGKGSIYSAENEKWFNESEEKVRECKASGFDGTSYESMLYKRARLVDKKKSF